MSTQDFLARTAFNDLANSIEQALSNTEGFRDEAENFADLARRGIRLVPPGVVANLSSFPANPEGGDALFVESEDQIYFFDSDSSTWKDSKIIGSAIFANIQGDPSDNTALQTALDDKASLLAAKAEQGSIKKTPLDIPTYDDDPNTTHPDVVYIPQGWNGYKYWMAFTPFPGNPRENPSIVASNDGTNWEVPEGLTNPLYTQEDAQADGYDFNSDPDMLLVDGTMYMYWRPAGLDGSGNRTEALMLKTSTDGINWSERQILLEFQGSDGSTSQFLSPGIIRKDNGDWLMFSINQTGSDDTIERWTSTDGINWTGRSAISADSMQGDVFHLDAAWTDDNRIHLLVLFSANLYYLWSDDDGDMFFSSGVNAIPQISQYDDFQRYRSTLQPVPGQQGTFHVWIVKREAVNGTTTAHRIMAFLPNIQLGNHNLGRQEIQKFISAREMHPREAAIEEKVVDFRNFGWELPDTGSTFLLASLYIPNWWPRLYYQVLYSNTHDGAAGDVFFQVNLMANRVSDPPLDISPSEVRDEITVPMDEMEKLSHFGDEYPESSFLDDNWGFRSGHEDFSHISIRLGRLSGNANDTHSGPVTIVGMRFSWKPFPTSTRLSSISEFPDR